MLAPHWGLGTQNNRYLRSSSRKWLNAVFDVQSMQGGAQQHDSISCKPLRPDFVPAETRRAPAVSYNP
jgi:hypothetical protein